MKRVTLTPKISSTLSRSYRALLPTCVACGLLLGTATAQPRPPGDSIPGAPGAPGGAAGDQVNEEEYAKDSSTEINVKNADIAAIVRIFSRKTKRNYILDEKVRGKVSIYLPGKVSSEESLRILDSVLALKGFTSVPIGENLWKIVPSKEARQSTIPTLTESRSDTPTAAVVTRLVNLKYVSAEDVQQILAQLISGDGLINAYTGTNSLILIDSEDNIERLVKLVNELDVPFSDRELTIIPLKFADVKDIATKLGDILGDPNKKGDAQANSDLLRARFGDPGQFVPPPTGLVNPGSPPAQRGGAGGGSKTVSARGREPKIIPDERTNSIIVVADDETTARVRALISQLDSKVDLSGSKFYVYRCQHANADQLAQVLAGLVGGSASGGSGSGGAGGGLFGSGNRNGGSSGSPFGGGSNSGFGNQGGLGSGLGNSGSQSGSGFGGGSGGLGGGGGFGGGGGNGSRGSGNRSATTAQLGQNISVTADPSTNSLIIAASKTDYEKIKGLLSQLDVKRRQVLVEATLLEVSIDNTIRTSMGFLTSTGGADGGGLIQSDFKNGNGSLNSLFTNPSALQGFTLAAASAGALKLPGGLTIPTQALIVSAAQANNNVNVLSAPTILGTDNEQAQIVVGQNVPFLASTSTNQTNLNNTFNQVSRQDVGITLRLTPLISSRDYVTLQMYTEVSALVQSTVNSQLGPTTTKRQTETKVIAKDGQMIVTGGLISDDVSETDEGVPFLKDIPVLGHAFKSNSQARLQKNLLIFLTPRIVKDQFDARDATIEGREKMEDIIAAFNVEPKRDELLTRETIDHVAESGTYTGPKPGTIRPSKRTLDAARAQAQPQQDLSANERSDRTEGEGTVVLDGSSDDVLDLRTEPALPSANDKLSLNRATGEQGQNEIDLGESDPSTEAAQLQADLSGRAALKQGVKSEDPAPGRELFLVLQLKKSADADKDLPFMMGHKGQLVGVVIPRDSSSQAKRYFAAGEQYKYSWNEEKVPVTVVGSFASIPEAHSVYPGMAQGWYTLSPYEIMNLGKGPWVKE